MCLFLFFPIEKKWKKERLWYYLLLVFNFFGEGWALLIIIEISLSSTKIREKQWPIENPIIFVYLPFLKLRMSKLFIAETQARKRVEAWPSVRGLGLYLESEVAQPPDSRISSSCKRKMKNGRPIGAVPEL